jgi:hypothetical protein
MADAEMELIGELIAVAAKGRTAKLDEPAWHRIEAYARSLCQQGAREAAERAREAAKPFHDAVEAVWREPEPEPFHILRQRRRRDPKALTWVS